MKTNAYVLGVMKSGKLASCLLCALALGAVSPAFATLGEKMTDIPTAAATATAATKQAVRHAAVHAGAYSVYESQLENGTTVKEFTDANGVVFAVSWKGPMLPDLQGLLGRHFEAFDTGAKRARKPGSLGAPLAITQDQVVIHSNGRMRHFFGHAYTPGQVPAGVNINDLLQ